MIKKIADMRRIIFFKMRYLLLLLCFFLFACTNNNRKKEAPGMSSDYTVINIENPVALSIDELFEIQDIIKLEVTDESVMGSISVMHIMDDKLYIYSRSQNTIYIFSDQGKYINKIFDKGQGPNEYVNIKSFETDHKKKQIIVTDAFSNKVLIYDSLGKHIKTITLDFFPETVASAGSGFIHFYSKAKGRYSNTEMENRMFHFLDDKGKFLYALKQDDTPLELAVAPYLELECLKDGTFLYHPALSDTIYSVNDSLIQAKYVLYSISEYKIMDYKKRQTVKFVIKPDSWDETYGGILKLIKENYLVTWGAVLDTDDYLFIDFAEGPETEFDLGLTQIYYNKNKGKAITVTSKHLSDNNNFLKLIFLRPRTADNNSFYTSPQYEFFEVFKDDVAKLPEGKLKTFISTINFEDDNPFIIKYTLKKNVFE